MKAHSISRTLLDHVTSLKRAVELQNRILELLKLGKTNKEIAEAIDYSESLVRHETMIIYKKLRVEGRHELREII